MDLSALTEHKTPVDCSSPGWRSVPYDIVTLVGGYVHFNCRSSIQHSRTMWMYNGRLLAGSSKVKLSADNTTLRYGPVRAEDSNVAIGCEVLTDYGPLPSPTGKITVMGEFSTIVCHTVINHYNVFIVFHRET